MSTNIYNTNEIAWLSHIILQHDECSIRQIQADDKCEESHFNNKKKHHARSGLAIRLVIRANGRGMRTQRANEIILNIKRRKNRKTLMYVVLPSFVSGRSLLISFVAKTFFSLSFQLISVSLQGTFQRWSFRIIFFSCVLLCFKLQLPINSR